MHFVGREEVSTWLGGGVDLERLVRGLGVERPDRDYLGDVLGVPAHLEVAAAALAAAGELDASALDSIPFHSLARGLFLPLSAMIPERALQLFGLTVPPPPGGEEREALLRRFLAADLGLSDLDKLACVLGDPFRGRPGRIRRESLLRVLASLRLVTRRELLDRLAVVGDPAVLFAEATRRTRSDPPLGAAEVLTALRAFPDVGRNRQLAALRSLVERCGRLEVYFLVRLVLGKAGLRYESELLARLLAERHGIEPEQVTHAMALTDAFHVAELLDAEGPEGLRKIELQPLVPVRPCLAASGSGDAVRRFPVWVERKYDGIRLMLHKRSDAAGVALAGAYSRNRRDYLELLPSLDGTIKRLPGRSFIIDGELHGVVVTTGGPRPATVYEVFKAMQGEPRATLRYAAFDLLHLDGVDLTSRPLAERRQRLGALLATVGSWPLPIPLTVAEGQTATGEADVKRLYEHFRRQGYEGIVAKDPQSPYRLATRDPSWQKRKPEVTLDLVLIAAVLAVTTKERAGMFGSYVLGARGEDGALEDVGDVAGIDRERDLEIQQAILREGLLTGQRIERAGVSGVRPGFELVPFLVGTVKMSGVIKDPAGKPRLRDPKLVALRPDKTPQEADTTLALEELFLRQNLG